MQPENIPVWGSLKEKCPSQVPVFESLVLSRWSCLGKVIGRLRIEALLEGLCHWGGGRRG